ncbi:MAG: UDP-N-acetylglucosamine 2-epimerase (hydrolyzing) [Candidatus Aureabacteria bacterium]|nr:UDP-N-acetylglucosamine 2-epimerase (hydrolyzing) [Candidatus Auribacterota bacterium]
MNNKRKICVVTGSRAIYGLVIRLLTFLKDDKDITLQLVVTGDHLSKRHGLTYKSIEKDGFRITAKVNIGQNDDTDISIIRSIGRGFHGFADTLKKLRPDIVVIPTDRYEYLAPAIAAMILRIPLAHLHGGETTEGAYDEAVRHSLTKMSSLHFVATGAYRKRVVQLGEDPARVFNVGALGVDYIKHMKLVDKSTLEQMLKIKLQNKIMLVTYHPVTLEKAGPGKDFKELLKALDRFKDHQIIFTKPNADTEGRTITRMIDDYASRRSHVASFVSLGQMRYCNLLRFVNVVVGNSSSGIIEAPSFRIPTVNIGDRQKGRIRARSVIDCRQKEKDIVRSIKIALSSKFRKKLKNMKNPYEGKGDAALKILARLKKARLDESCLKKKFFDISFSLR